MENRSSCTVKLWMYLGGLLSSQELGEVLVCKRHQRAQKEYEARSRCSMTLIRRIF